MHSTYEQYLKLNLNGSLIGLEKVEENFQYYCTPKNAEVIGCIGVDGIHFCFVKGLGDMVFCVNPMESAGENVHLVAADFIDFLRLILTFGSADVLEQLHGFSKWDVDAILKEYGVAPNQKRVLKRIQEEFQIQPMEDLFGYQTQLEHLFDCSMLEFPDEYYEGFTERVIRLPEWKVFFDSGFWPQEENQEAGQEIPVKQSVPWEKDTWWILSLYLCREGLVLDVCKEIQPSEIKAFRDKWYPEGTDYSTITKEQIEQMAAENPTDESIRPSLFNDEIELAWSGTSGVGWNPCLQPGEDNSLEAKSAVQHYGLDKDKGWLVERMSFAWPKQGNCVVRDLKLMLSQNPVALAGPHLTDLREGQIVQCQHPFTGEQYSMTVKEIRQEKISMDRRKNSQWIYPECLTQLSYTLEPDLSADKFRLVDCAEGDRPLEREHQCKTNSCSSNAIIGGADGPTAIFVASKSTSKKLHIACSSLHFEPVYQMEWRIVFSQKMREDITIPISIPT